MIILYEITTVCFFVISSIILTYSIDSEVKKWMGLANSFIGLAFLIVSFLYMLKIEADVYKLGQIDAYNGNIRYELKLQPDSSKTWELKK